MRSRPQDLWLPIAPALLAGAHLAGLLLFLNSEQPLSLAVLAQGTLAFGALLAPFSIAAHLGLARWRHRRLRRLLPWSLTVVVATGALADAVHASRYALYLPPGINVQLLKTALWLGLGAVLAFYTALLHTVHRRAYGRRSIALLLAVALGTVYAMFDRRTNFRPAPPAPRRLVAVEPEAAPRLVVVALAGATLDALLPLAEQGKLPAFAALLEQGATARLGDFEPTRPTALWASWATAKLPFRHGLLDESVLAAGRIGFARPLRLRPLWLGFDGWGTLGGERAPIGAAERTALTVWEILGQAERSTLVAGFPPALATEQGLPELPALAPLGAETALAESGWGELAAGLAEDRRRLAAVRARLAAPAPPAASFVMLPGFEAAALATFGGFVRAEFEGSRAGEARRAADALATYLAGLDSELGALWESLPPPRVLVVSSAYGVGGPRPWRRLARELAGTGGTTGTRGGDGLLLMRGEEVRLGVRLADARLFDVAPTLLYALGLPIARDLDGRVLAEAFEPALLQRRSIAFLPSYERGESGASGAPSRR